MKNLFVKNCLLCLMLIAVFSGCARRTERGRAVAVTENSPLTYILPPPNITGNVSVEQALANRRSHRRFQDRALSAEQLSQMLWAAYGITSPRHGQGLRGGLRTTPSAGALFPLEIYAVIGNVIGIEPGVYRYDSQEHRLIKTISGDIRNELAAAALGQNMIREAPVTIVYAGVLQRLTIRYGRRAERYMWIEAGHSAQNVYLQAEALGLGTVAVGAFTDAQVSAVLGLPAEEEPLYLMPIGFRR